VACRGALPGPPHGCRHRIDYHPPQTMHHAPPPPLFGAIGLRCPPRPKRLVIEARWGSKPLAFAGKLPPRRLNNQPL
jgi:hypothetical protein